MDNFYIKIDDLFLKKISPKARSKLRKELEEELSKKPDQISYIRMCPYCNGLYRISTNMNIDSPPHFCVLCGESTPNYKINYSLKKANILFKISALYASRDKTNVDREKQRVLFEQSIVILATGVELFFRDMYVVGMDLKYVKNEHTLFKKFYKDIRNEFINIGKVNEKFKNDLGIDLKKILGDENLKKLNIMMLKRNVIVHNNGNADKAFIETSGIKCSQSRPIPISKREIKRNFSDVKTMIEKFQKEYGKLIMPEFIKKIDHRFSKVQ